MRTSQLRGQFETSGALTPTPLPGGGGIHLVRLILAALLFFVASIAWAQQAAIPALKARVTDTTGTLAPTEIATLEQKLAALEQRKGSQVAVLLVPTTGDETIEQYSIRVVEAWNLGRKSVDDGALLLIAKSDRNMRIEVGYGLEGALPDAIAKRIIAETITPFFKRGDFYGGVTAGVDAMIAVVDGEPLPAPSGNASRSPESATGDPIEIIAVIIGVVVGFVVRAATNRVAGGLSALVVAGIAATIFAGFAVAVFCAFFAFAVVVGNGRGGGFSGGGGSGGGGFSGGGGSFGGGGASGRW